jgi:hypothetical protein
VDSFHCSARVTVAARLCDVISCFAGVVRSKIASICRATTRGTTRTLLIRIIRRASRPPCRTKGGTIAHLVPRGPVTVPDMERARARDRSTIRGFP